MVVASEPRVSEKVKEQGIWNKDGEGQCQRMISKMPLLYRGDTIKGHKSSI